GVLDGNVTRSAPPEDALTRGEVDLLQQESQAKSSQSNHPGAERVIAMRTEAPSAPAHGDYSRYPATRSASKPRPPSVRRGAVRAAKGSGGDVLRRRSEDVRLGASSAGGARTRKRGTTARLPCRPPPRRRANRSSAVAVFRTHGWGFGAVRAPSRTPAPTRKGDGPRRRARGSPRGIPRGSRRGVQHGPRGSSAGPSRSAASRSCG